MISLLETLSRKIQDSRLRCRSQGREKEMFQAKASNKKKRYHKICLTVCHGLQNDTWPIKGVFFPYKKNNSLTKLNIRTQTNQNIKRITVTFFCFFSPASVQFFLDFLLLLCIFKGFTIYLLQTYTRKIHFFLHV